MMRNQQNHQTREISSLLMIIFLLAGVALVGFAELGPETVLGLGNSWQRNLLNSLGVFILGVLAVSWLYEKFLIEKHFGQFRQLIHEQIRAMDTVQSKCLKLGIGELFETRSELEMAHPFADRINSVKPNGRVLCIERSLFHFLNREAELKAALERGALI